jgi:hypothetical protein
VHAKTEPQEHKYNSAPKVKGGGKKPNTKVPTKGSASKPNGGKKMQCASCGGKHKTTACRLDPTKLKGPAADVLAAVAAADGSDTPALPPQEDDAAAAEAAMAEMNAYIVLANKHCDNPILSVDADEQKNRVAAAETEAQIRAKAKKTRKLIVKNCISKAETMLLTKNMDSPEDRAIVMRSICVILRSENWHEHVLDDDPPTTRQLPHVAARVMQRALKRVAVARHKMEEARANSEATPLKVFLGTATGFRKYRTSASVVPTTIGRLHEKETFEAETVVRSKSQVVAYCAGRMAELVRVAAFAGLEELVIKGIATAVAKYLTVSLLVALGVPNAVAVTVAGSGLIIASALISLYESKIRGESVKQALARTVAHFVLSSTGGIGVLIHVLWNTIVHNYHPEWKLDVFAGVGNSDYSRLLKSKHNRDNVVMDVCAKELGHVPVQTQDHFKVAWADEQCAPLFAARATFCVEGFRPSVYRSCTCNERIGLCGRVGKRIPSTQNDAIQKAVTQHWKEASKLLTPHFDDLVDPVTRPQDREEWLKSFPPARREAFLTAIKNGEELPRKKVASSFVKAELALQDSEVKLSDPRIIQGCPLLLTWRTGPYIRRLAKNYKKCLKPKTESHLDFAAGRNIFYTCGMKNSEIGDAFATAIRMIESVRLPGEKIVYVEDDQSRFDLHLGKGAFSTLSRHYTRKIPRKVRRDLARTDKSSGKTRRGTKYSVPYTMQSGWPDTSYGDTYLNGIMKTFIHGLHRRWVSIICGDDSVTVTLDSEVERLGGRPGMIAAYDKFGMEVKVKVSSDPAQVEFCSGRFAPRGETYVLVPMTGKILARLGWDKTNRNARGQKAWCRGIACTLQQYGAADPILGALGDALLKDLGVGRTIEHAQNQYSYLVDGSARTTRADYLAYYDAVYGLSANDVDRCIALMRRQNFQSVISDSTIISMVRIDLGR